jgi:hypothetical protein
LQESPTPAHVYECQLRIITQGIKHIDPEHWHLVLLCRYPPFDNSSSPDITAAPNHVLAPLDNHAQLTVENGASINVSCGSAFCQAQEDVAEEMQVDQLLEMDGVESGDGKREEYEWDTDEVLWMMVSFVSVAPLIVVRTDAESCMSRRWL